MLCACNFVVVCAWVSTLLCVLCASYSCFFFFETSTTSSLSSLLLLLLRVTLSAKWLRLRYLHVFNVLTWFSFSYVSVYFFRRISNYSASFVLCICSCWSSWSFGHFKLSVYLDAEKIKSIDIFFIFFDSFFCHVFVCLSFSLHFQFSTFHPQILRTLPCIHSKQRRNNWLQNNAIDGEQNAYNISFHRFHSINSFISKNQNQEREEDDNEQKVKEMLNENNIKKL